MSDESKTNLINCIINREFDIKKSKIDLNLIEDVKSISYSYNLKSKFTRIDFNNDIRGGKPCVKGTRITVMDVLLYLSDKTSYNEVMDEFPELTEEDIKECLTYSNDVLCSIFEYIKNNK